MSLLEERVILEMELMNQQGEDMCEYALRLVSMVMVMVIGIKLMNLYEKEALGGHGSWVAIGGQSHESQVGIDMGGHGYCHHEPAVRRLGVFMIMDHGWSWVNRSS